MKVAYLRWKGYTACGSKDFSRNPTPSCRKKIQQSVAVLANISCLGSQATSAQG